MRYRMSFYGRVQAVGFRYTACHAAERYRLTGWVRNDYDGSVTMELQGSEGQIDQVILAIERGTYIHIENMDCRSVPLVPEEREFRVSR